MGAYRLVHRWLGYDFLQAAGRLSVRWSPGSGASRPRHAPAPGHEQEFGFDPQILARLYVEPNLQDFNPPDLDTDPGRRVSKEPALQWFRDDCARDITNENGARILFILGDAGKGKTSLLVRLKCLDLEKPLREGHRAELMRLNSDTLARIQAITDPIHTLLLLDSLDEDPEAHHASRGAAERLRQLFPHLQRFFRVVISSRTQFFPETSPHLTDRPGSFCLDAYRCPLKYLSLFNDQQVDTFLRQRFTPSDFRSVFKRLLSDKADQKLERARTAARAMESLRMRPLLLSYIEDFVTGEGATQLDHRNRYAVYDFLVSQWLQRERRLNKHLGLDIEQGWSVATALAIHLTATDRRKIPRAELLNIPGLEAIDRFQIESRSLLNRTTHFEFQFAHATFQEFLVARALLKNDASLTGKRLRLSPVTGRFLIDGYSMLGRTINVKTLHGAVLASPCAPLCRLFLGVDMIEVSPGTFQMGSPENEPSRLNDEGPQHSVTLTHGFWLGKFPVTQGQYLRVMGINPSEFKGPNQPVERVSSREAVAFCERLTQEGLESGVLPPDWEFRLPTEAEWEYACRAGTTSAFNDGSLCTRPEGKDPALDRLGWFDKNSRTKTHPVGEKQPNAWGFHDCHGNVWEWCLDDMRMYRDQAESDPVGLLDGAGRVLRGGSCWYDAGCCRSALRNVSDLDDRYRGFGFRLAAGQRLGIRGALGRSAGLTSESPSYRPWRSAGTQPTRKIS